MSWFFKNRLIVTGLVGFGIWNSVQGAASNPFAPLDDVMETANSVGSHGTEANAQYYAAFGAVVFGMAELADDPQLARYQGLDGLKDYILNGRGARLSGTALGPLVKNADELADEELLLHALGESVKAYGSEE